MGIGERGIKAKVTKGCIEAGKKLKKYAMQDINLIVNVYGFSRGATAARHFLFIATNPAETLIVFKNEGVALAPYGDYRRRININVDDQMLQYGYFGACLIENNVQPKIIKFNFVGLYDTVASYGANHRGAIGGILGDDTEQLKLSAINKAFFVLQIASGDEYRDNFDLTNISSAGVKGLEFTLPGVHSDIGGCYVYGEEEKVDIFKEIGNNGADCEAFKKILEEEGWFKNWQLKIDKRISDMAPTLQTMYVLVGQRRLFNTYDRIPLNKMFHFSDQFSVKYKGSKIKEDHVIQEELLKRVFDIFNRYTNACTELRSKYVDEYNRSNSSGDYVEKLKALRYENFIDINNLKEIEDIKTLRNQFLHWSASVTKVGLGPKVGNVTNGKERIRNIQNG